MEYQVQCNICLDEDKDGMWFQCDNGHYMCKDCYNTHYNFQQAQFVRRPRCPECVCIWWMASPSGACWPRN